MRSCVRVRMRMHVFICSHSDFVPINSITDFNLLYIKHTRTFEAAFVGHF